MTPPTASHDPYAEPYGDEGDQPLVRPYAMTGGRTRPRYQLAIEALISTTADPAALMGLLPEHQRICHLCREVKSVAEVSRSSPCRSVWPASWSRTSPRPDWSPSTSRAATRTTAVHQR